MALAQAAAQGMEMGQKTPSKYGGISDMITAVTADLRKQKADKDKKIQETRSTNTTLFSSLLKSGYKPTSTEGINAFLDTGDLSGFTKGGANAMLGEAPQGMKIKGATMNPEGETSYSYEPVSTKGKTMVTPQINKISGNEDAYYTLGNSVNDLETNKEKFAKFMGPGKGLLRNPILSYGSKDLQDFLAWKANVQDAFQQYRVAVTGAQASDKEIALLAKNRPTEDDTYEVFIKKAAEVRKVGNKVLQRYITNLGRAGYDISGFQDTLDSLNMEIQGMPVDNSQQMLNPNANSGNRIPVIAPDGTPGSVSPESLEEALASGFRRR